MRVASAVLLFVGLAAGELQVVGIGNVVVLGCYRSGSSLLAGMLHCLGVNLGPPFWGDFYEPADLSAELRRWWDEPRLNPMVPQVQRIEYLRQWQQRQANHASLGGGEVPSVGTTHLSVGAMYSSAGAIHSSIGTGHSSDGTAHSSSWTTHPSVGTGDPSSGLGIHRLGQSVCMLGRSIRCCRYLQRIC